MDIAPNRQALRRFLMDCRARLRPEDVGLTSIGRRRVPGLRREELAQLADISPAWYTLLETARDISVSPRLLDRLALALRLSKEEKVHLFSLAIDQLPTVPLATAEAAGEGDCDLSELHAFARRLLRASGVREVGEIERELLYDLVRPAPIAYFVAADVELKTFKFLAARAASGEAPLPKESLSFSTVHDARPVLVEGGLFVENDARHSSHAIFAPLAKAGGGRFMSAGIKVPEFDGAIGVFQAADGAFSERAQSLLRLVSEVVSLALEARA